MQLEDFLCTQVFKQKNCEQFLFLFNKLYSMAGFKKKQSYSYLLQEDILKNDLDMKHSFIINY